MQKKTIYNRWKQTSIVYPFYVMLWTVVIFVVAAMILNEDSSRKEQNRGIKHSICLNYLGCNNMGYLSTFYYIILAILLKDTVRSKIKEMKKRLCRKY